MRGDKNKLIIGILIIIILILICFMAYSFLIKPSFTGYVIEKQIEAQNYFVAGMINQIQQQGFVQLQIGNQTLTLVPYQEPQQ